MNQKHSQYRPLQVVASFFVTLLVASACTREPILHLHEEGHLPNVDTDLPIVEIGLDVFWDYRLVYGDDYDWEKEWYYGWDDTDRDLFGELGYKEPKTFQLRRYFTDQVPRAPHTTVDEYYLEQPHFEDRFKWGFHDILVWNNVETLDGVQSLNFDETTSLDYVTAYTNPPPIPVCSILQPVPTSCPNHCSQHTSRLSKSTRHSPVSPTIQCVRYM